ncbi:MAG: SDR family NAD(P)-dependent oxidoreductase [Schaedlerella sp.]|uniref:SDR family NAD(P)-dependent oxidoreductase n=1 Tax=Mediterraneibacter glycyrrhizinilyticus TaxID=342942 RepID=UPI00189FB3DF|nr:SDR family NAD(P)-dependent oxidoreductase [Mediterraneibacter glycyrrhizinilyticus]
MSENSLINKREFSAYLDELKQLKNCIVIMAVRDTIVTSPTKTNIKKEEYSKLQTLGLSQLRTDNIAQQFWSGYAAVIFNGDVIYEKLDEKRENVEYKTLIDGVDIQILSSPYKKMDRASIIVEGKEVAVDQRGLNIVVIDSKKKSVIDSVVFDTWEEKIGITRKRIKDDYNMTEMEQKHYDVGIFGLWYGRNYGSMVTYFALDEVLKGMGYSTVMIKNPLGREGINLETLPKSHSLRFAEKHYDITPLYNLNEMFKLNRMCDKFVLGSDQMWNYGLSKPYRQSYYFDFVEDEKKAISYATSFGKDTYNAPEEYAKEVQKNLARFTAISVRDDFSKRICAENFGIKAEQVLDSVFLCPLEKYEELTQECTNIRKDFLFAYILDPRPEFGEEIKKIAEKTEKNVIVIFNEGDNKAEAKKKLALDYKNVEYWDEATLNEWLYCFKNADFVITDSFHGSVFASIFSNEFIVKKNFGRGGGRFDCLMDQLGLRNRMVEKISDISTLFEHVWLKDKIDYHAVQERLQPEIDKSYKWFKDALELPKEKLPPVVLADKTVTTPAIWKNIKCTGCGACSNVCPADAITMLPNKDGFLNPSVDYDKCINCGLCEKKCVALHPKYENYSKPECYAFWASDEIRAVSSSGGVFTVAAEYILDKGGYVAGTIYNEDYSVRHTIIHSKDELWKMRGSKYMQSDVQKIYRDVKILLNQGELVLFTGLPCHIAALYSCLGGRKYKNLYTIDLVCHGITSQKVFDKFHADVLGGKKLTDLQFKAKQPWGWHAGTNARFEDGTSYSVPLERCPYFIAYLKCISKNTTCGECQFNKLPRQADLSIGDFWGINKYNAEYNDQKGTSEILVNNERGAEFLEELRGTAKLMKPVPLEIALNGNHVMKKPYRMHKNRNYFFKHLDDTNFKELTLSCFRDDFSKQEEKILKDISPNMHNLYYLGKIVAENAKGRKVVAWGEGKVSKKIFKKYFDIDIAFTVFAYGHPVNGTTTRAIESLKGKSNEYYIVSLGHAWDAKAEKLLKDLGFQNEKDYIFRVHKPIVLENYDLSKGNYSDIYGNRIVGTSGILKKIVFRGLNSRIELGRGIHIGKSLNFDMDTNALVEIGDGCRFAFDVTFELKGNVIPLSTVKIGKKCRFLDALFRVYGHAQNSSIIIGDESSFESNLDMHANAGKKLIIGRDCMFSHDISVWAGDGHTLFDVTTGKNTNSDYDNLPECKNKIVLGDHVWVGKGAFILAGTNIDTGSVVGAQSVVKGTYPNNCVIAGNPAKLVKYDTAWSRDIVTTDIKRCGSDEYVKLTNRSGEKTTASVIEKSGIIDKNKIQNWLVTGGSTGFGRALVIRLHELGYKVVATSRDISKLKELPRGIVKLQVDVTDIDSCREAIKMAIEQLGKIDVLVNNAGLSHTSSFEETPEEIEEQIMATNYWGVSNMVKSIIPYMRMNRNGTVINISSASGFRARNFGSHYVASKFAVDNLTKNLKFECQKFMRFMAVELGGINTGLIKRQTVIHTQIDEYKNLPQLYPYERKYVNKIGKTVDAVIETVNHKELPRDLILGWDAYQQFPQVMRVFDEETEKYKNVSISTDLAKKDNISLKDITLPRNKKLKMQNWLITGASGGCGKVLALRLKKLGYTVAVTSRDMSRLESMPEGIYKIESQLDSSDTCEKAIQTAIDMMGSVDVLVNNATSNCWSSFEECPDDIMEKVFNVNYTIPKNMMRAVLPHMRTNKNGTVINITSIAGIQPRARVSTYSAAKAALEGLTRTLKSECQRFARFMAVEFVCMRTGIMIHNPVIDTQIEDYKNLGRYTQEVPTIPNRKDIAAQQIINVANQDILPQSLLIGTESYLVARNEIKRAKEEFEKYKEITLSVCDPK